MKFTLKVLDRIMLGVVCPVTGNYVTMETVRSIKDKARLSAAELVAVSMQNDENGNMHWNPAADVGTELDFIPAEYGLICKALRELDDKQTLTTDHLSLYKVFIGGPNQTILPFTQKEAA